MEATPYEDAVTAVVDDVLTGGPEVLSEFRERISEHRKSNSERFSLFKEAAAEAIKRLGWYVQPGCRLARGLLVRVRDHGGDPALGRHRRLPGRRAALERHRADRARGLRRRQRGHPRDRRDQRPAVAAADTRGCARGRTVGRVPPLPPGLDSTSRPSRRSSCGSATSSTGLRSALPTRCSRPRTCTCRKRCTTGARSTGSPPTATSAAARRRSGSASSAPGSAPRSRRRRAPRRWRVLGRRRRRRWRRWRRRL